MGNTKHGGIFGNDTWNLGTIFFILYMILGSSSMKEMKNQAVICGHNEDALSLYQEFIKKTEFHIL